MHVWSDAIAAPLAQVGLPADAVWHTVRVENAAALSAEALTNATLNAYRQLRAVIDAGPARHLVRVWNFVPAITAPTQDGRDRYMAFNAGRYAAMSEWLGVDQLLARAPAATGVGTGGSDLLIHALAAAAPGQSVQNPAQTPAVNYSTRYGPRPPCFARATRIGRTLLVAGTAAICGEDSVAGDLERQLDVAVGHLATLSGDMRAYVSLRAYLPDPSDAAAVHARLTAAAGPHAAIDLVRADLCRRELRVEIEGVAEESARP